MSGLCSWHMTTTQNRPINHYILFVGDSLKTMLALALHQMHCIRRKPTSSQCSRSVPTAFKRLCRLKSLESVEAINFTFYSATSNSRMNYASCNVWDLVDRHLPSIGRLVGRWRHEQWVPLPIVIWLKWNESCVGLHPKKLFTRCIWT